MTRLKWWMRVVGAFYILLAIQNLPPLVAQRLLTQYIGLDGPFNGVAIQALLDMWFLFGTEVGIVGLMLLVASRAPVQNRILAQTVLVLELVRGVAQDLYWLTRGYYQNTFYTAFIAIHLVIIVTGYLFLRHAEAESRIT